MISQAYFREKDGYTRGALRELLGNCSNAVVNRILGRLVENGMANVSGLPAEGKKVRELAPVEIAGAKDVSCTINFVGVIVDGDHVLRCHPKYIPKGNCKAEDLQQVLEVIEFYYERDPDLKSKRKNPMEEASGAIDKGSSSMLSLMRWLMLDYYENGVYTNTRDVIETNGEGEILWDKTINGTVALISKKRPYYMDLLTRRHVSDESDYCRRLHECILTEISGNLVKWDLLELLKLTKVELTDEKKEDFGDTGYILYRIERELNTQFNTRKQLLLRNMYDYIKDKDTISDRDGFMFLGVSKFDAVWENVCAYIMGNRLDTKLETLDKELGPLPSSPGPLCKDYAILKKKIENIANIKKKDKKQSKNESELTLKDLIESPNWSKLKQENQPDETETGEDPDEAKKDAQPAGKLRLDLVTITDPGIDGRRRFIIFDAKYYDAYSLTEGEKPGSLPGVPDITKQYLYQLAFQPFIRAYGLKPRNCFLMPSKDNDKVGFGGKVSLEMLGNLLQRMLGEVLLKWLMPDEEGETNYIDKETAGLQDIKVRFLPVHRAYECYLNGSLFPVDELELDSDK